MEAAPSQRTSVTKKWFKGGKKRKKKSFSACNYIHNKFHLHVCAWWPGSTGLVNESNGGHSSPISGWMRRREIHCPHGMGEDFRRAERVSVCVCARVFFLHLLQECDTHPYTHTTLWTCFKQTHVIGKWKRLLSTPSQCEEETKTEVNL